jgi:hypothetical protein
VELLEREAELAVFDAAFADAARGAGQVLLVAGEAGLGKTSSSVHSWTGPRTVPACSSARATTC